MIRVNEFIPITNGFAFAEVFTKDMEVTRQFVEVITGKKISDIRVAHPERTVLAGITSKSIRYDLLLESQKEYIDLEMQLYNDDDVLRRIRYYHSAMDAEVTRRGELYSDLKDSIVIFIYMNNDPFKKGRTIYEIKKTLADCDNMIVEDGQYSFIVNFSAFRKRTDNTELEYLVDYFRKREVNGKLTERIDFILSELNDKPVWRENIMTLDEMIEKARLEERKKAEEEKNLAIAEERKQTVLKMIGKGFEVQTVSEIMDLPVEDIISFVKDASKE